ncbi:MAG TPA: rhomboid family intramembrane serine protease, partial [Gaiellaceae bacterium]|nr:rhomboid family intramembrane serine protease [Gaiellaceae bacterium]
RYCYRHPDRETGLSCSECDRPICYECMTPAPVGLRCPEHSGKPQGVQRVTRPAQRAVTGVGARRTNLITLTLIGINVLVYLAELAAGGTVDGQSNTIYDHGALVTTAQYGPGGALVGVAHGEWWRLFTAAFLHYGPLHLGLNMYSLYLTGSLLEHVVGRWRFLLLYVVAGLAGSAGALIASPNAITVGASGAIFGVFGALFVLERARHIASGGQIAALIVLNLVFSFLLPGISIGGHIGGLIGGAVLMWVLLNVRRSNALSFAASVAAGAIAIAVAIWRARGYA